MKLIEASTPHETFGRGTSRHGNAAMAKRSVVISSGENSLSAIRLATKASPQITATRTAMQTSAGFIFLGSVGSGLCRFLLALLVRLRLAQDISAVEGRVIVDQFQREADIGQHALDDPAKGRIFVAHMGDHALALEIVVLDRKIRPLLDIALGAVGHADEDDVAQVEIGAGLQRGVDPCQRHRLPEIRQMMQREFADDQIIGIRLVGKTQHAGRLGADRHLAVAGLDVGERQHRRRNIDRVDFGAHQRRLARQYTVAAADIGHPPALLHAEHGQRRAGAEVAVVMPIVDRGDRGIEPELPPLIVIPVPRQHVSHPFRPAPDRGNAGARHLDKAERAHQVDELTDLGRVACDLEHKALDGGVDHPGAERVRQPQRLDAAIAAAAHLHHGEFPLDRAAGDRHVDDAIHRHHAVELVLDLLDHHRRARGDDGDAGEMFLALGFGNGEAFDIVTAAGKQPDHAREHARLVLHQHRERVRTRSDHGALPGNRRMRAGSLSSP